MVMDLTGMEMANASLLDEATAAAEAMALCKRAGKITSNVFFVADDVHPQTLDVVQTRAKYFGFEIVSGPADELASTKSFGALLQYPGTTGQVRDLTPLIEAAHEQKAHWSRSRRDLLSLALLKPPGEMGADIVLGSAQRFGVPMGFGGPHAAFFATRDEYKRSAPGRIIGVSKDRRGKAGFADGDADPRTTYSPRQSDLQHLHGPGAAGQHGRILRGLSWPAGIKRSPNASITYAQVAAAKLADLGFAIEHEHFFDTLVDQDRQGRRNFRSGRGIGIEPATS